MKAFTTSLQQAISSWVSGKKVQKKVVEQFILQTGACSKAHGKKTWQTVQALCSTRTAITMKAITNKARNGVSVSTCTSLNVASTRESGWLIRKPDVVCAITPMETGTVERFRTDIDTALESISTAMGTSMLESGILMSNTELGHSFSTTESFLGDSLSGERSREREKCALELERSMLVKIYIIIIKTGSWVLPFLFF